MFTANRNTIGQYLGFFFSPESVGSGVGATEEVIIPPVEEVIPDLSNEKIDELIEHPEKLKDEIVLATETPEQKTEREKTEADTKKAEAQAETDRLEFEKKRADENDEQHKARLAEAEKQKSEASEVKIKLPSTFKTYGQLLKGFENAAKYLNYNPKLTQKLIEDAKKSGDYSAIADLYPELDKDITEKKKALQSQGQHRSENTDQPEKVDKPIPKADENVRAEMYRLSIQGTLDNIGKTKIGEELADANIALPPNFLFDKDITTKFLKELRTEDPVLFMHLENEIVRSVQENLNEIQEVYTALADAETRNPKLIESEIAKIKQLATDAGLTVVDSEITEFVDSLKDNHDIYEEKAGVMFIRPDSISRRWLVENYDKIKEQIKINALIEGRTQGVTDLERNKKRVPGSISNSDLPAAQRARQEKAGKIDTSDEKVREALTDAQLDEYIDRGLPGKK
jgi:hypothetical protein